ncbi:MAG: N-acetylmuramoyl-L-alanine amidase [Clostridia bacterium]|nr:N-acetylmuramoyl-L-alanine amidase [Clostridia bacterium]
MKRFFKKYKIPLTVGITILSAAILALIFALAIAEDAKEIFASQSTSSNGSVTIEEEIIYVESLPSESQEEPTEQVIAPLVITSPSAQDTTVTEPSFAISGTSDPSVPLVLNGQEITRLESGEFSIDVELKAGNNTFDFEYNGEKISYIVRYNFTVIKAYAPYEKQSYEAGSSFVVVALARVDSSSVTATFNGKTIKLIPQPYKDGELFTNFTGSFTLPTGNENDLNLGGVKFTGSCNGVTKSYTSPGITCLRDKALDGTQIVEIVASQAETFNGDTTDDWSRPTNSYLPKGTLDYKVGGIVYEPDSGNSYYNLRCGKRVYITKNNAPATERVTVSKVYKGELPESNSIGISKLETKEKHTYISFDTLWKAPFAVEIGPQSYTNPAKQDYSISSATYSYIDIKFFYTDEIRGDLEFVDNPIFKDAEIIEKSDGFILRLHLNNVGAFYGWNAEYNDKGQLVFEFLNPPTVTKKNDLTGIKIVIDPGHGGRDIGAPGLRQDTNPEAERNLSLAYKLKAKLESYGATVVMTRTTDKTMTADERCEFLRRESPDLCISIHHDSSTRASASGGSFFCFNAFSDEAVKYIYNSTATGGFYKEMKKGWHYFYMARVTSCPVVLTENGFISNLDDFAGIIDESTNTKKADKITQGVLNYFNSFYKNVANEPDNSYNGDDYGPNGGPQEPEDALPPDEDLETEENNNIGDEE